MHRKKHLLLSQQFFHLHFAYETARPICRGHQVQAHAQRRKDDGITRMATRMTTPNHRVTIPKHAEHGFWRDDGADTNNQSSPPPTLLLKSYNTSYCARTTSAISTTLLVSALLINALHLIGVRIELLRTKSYLLCPRLSSFRHRPRAL